MQNFRHRHREANRVHGEHGGKQKCHDGIGSNEAAAPPQLLAVIVHAHPADPEKKLGVS